MQILECTPPQRARASSARREEEDRGAKGERGVVGFVDTEKGFGFLIAGQISEKKSNLGVRVSGCDDRVTWRWSHVKIELERKTMKKEQGIGLEVTADWGPNLGWGVALGNNFWFR